MRGTVLKKHMKEQFMRITNYILLAVASVLLFPSCGTENKMQSATGDNRPESQTRGLSGTQSIPMQSAKIPTQTPAPYTPSPPDPSKVSALKQLLQDGMWNSLVVHRGPESGNKDVTRDLSFAKTLSEKLNAATDDRAEVLLNSLRDETSGDGISWDEGDYIEFDLMGQPISMINPSTISKVSDTQDNTLFPATDTSPGSVWNTWDWLRVGVNEYGGMIVMQVSPAGFINNSN
jgi:hypothetical protein